VVRVGLVRPVAPRSVGDVGLEVRRDRARAVLVLTDELHRHRLAGRDLTGASLQRADLGSVARQRYRERPGLVGVVRIGDPGRAPEVPQPVVRGLERLQHPALVVWLPGVGRGRRGGRLSGRCGCGGLAYRSGRGGRRERVRRRRGSSGRAAAPYSADDADEQDHPQCEGDTQLLLALLGGHPVNRCAAASPVELPALRRLAPLRVRLPTRWRRPVRRRRCRPIRRAVPTSRWLAHARTVSPACPLRGLTPELRLMGYGAVAAPRRARPECAADFGHFVGRGRIHVPAALCRIESVLYAGESRAGRRQ